MSSRSTSSRSASSRSISTHAPSTRAAGSDPVRRRLVIIATGAVVVLAGLTACSLPVDERVTPLDQSLFPDDLTEETTTTTTSTTVPETTVPEDTGVTAQPTTTTVPIVPTEAVTVYYTRGVTDVMQPVEVPRPVPTPVTDLITLLEQPTGISEFGFRSAVRPGLIDDINPVDRGVATVQLDPDVLDRMSESSRQQAIAQIVLSVTSFRTADVGAIGRVRFEVDGEGFPVYVPAFEGTSEAGEELAFTDFQSLIATTPTPPGTTTTTAPTTTSESDVDGQ